MIHIYYGDGKGKTTAAMGLLLRAAGSGMRSAVFQFLKDGSSSEISVLKTLDNVFIYPTMSYPFTFLMNDEQRHGAAKQCSEMLCMAAELTQKKKCDFLLLDEVFAAVSSGLLQTEALHELIKASEGIELVLTGRCPDEFCLKSADYISKIKKIKHPYDMGIMARKGIEY